MKYLVVIAIILNVLSAVPWPYHGATWLRLINGVCLGYMAAQIFRS